MAKLTANTSWQNVTLDNAEVWQCTGGSLRLYCLDGETTPDADRGIELATWESISFASGQTVYYKIGGQRSASSVATYERIEVA